MRRSSPGKPYSRPEAVTRRFRSRSVSTGSISHDLRSVTPALSEERRRLHENNFAFRQRPAPRNASAFRKEGGDPAEFFAQGIPSRRAAAETPASTEEGICIAGGGTLSERKVIFVKPAPLLGESRRYRTEVMGNAAGGNAARPETPRDGLGARVWFTRG